MDPRSMAPTASSLVFLYIKLAKAINNLSQRYEAAPATTSISAECSAISATLLDIQSLLSQPYGLSSRVISQVKLEEALTNAQNSCNFMVTRIEEEARNCIGDRPTTGENLHKWNMTYMCDEVLIKGLLQQLLRQLRNINLLIAAAHRDSSSDVRQLLQNDIFVGDLIDIRDSIDMPSPTKPGGYTQDLWEQLDPDSKTLGAHTSPSVSGFSYGSGQSEIYNLLDDEDEAGSIMSKSYLAPQSNKAKKVPRAKMGSMFFKLFHSNTELHRAAKKGDAKKIKALLDLGVDINYEGASGCTALHLATDCGHEAVVRVLLNNGADPMAKSSEGRTPLHTAARNGHTAVVRLLLEKGVNARAKDPAGSSALHIAAYNGQESVVQILLEKYPFVELRGPSGFTSLHVAAFSGQSAVVRLLIDLKADIEARSDTGRTALQLAAEKGHEAVVRHLLQHGANAMAKDNLGRTAVQGAVSNQHGVVAQLLVDKVVLVSPSHRQHQGGSVSGPSFELDAVERVVNIPELDTIQPATWSRQAPNPSINGLSGSLMRFELPADEVNVRLRSPSSITRRMTPLPNRTRAGLT